jgi:CBS domain-containing protein
MEILIGTVLDQKGHDVYSIQTVQSVFEAIAQMDAHNVGALIVMEGQNVAGIITERDYLRKVILKGRLSKDTPVADIMSRNLIFITPEDSVVKGMALMTAKRCRHLPVFKEGQLTGIVSVGDLVKSIIAQQEFKIQMLENYIFGR